MHRLASLERRPRRHLEGRRLHCRIFFLHCLISKSCARYSCAAPLLTPCKVLFAACASVLVKNHAIYAKHSGIPEIKTVLGGFVIRYFMGGWTLIIKSLGLVRIYSQNIG